MNREEVEVSVPGPSSSHPNPNRESSRSKRRRLDNEQKESRKQRLVDAMKLYESQRTDLKNKHKKSELSAYEKLKEAISNDYPGTSTPTIRILFFCWIRIRIRWIWIRNTGLSLRSYTWQSICCILIKPFFLLLEDLRAVSGLLAALPPTQVSVERLFSAMKILKSDTRAQYFSRISTLIFLNLSFVSCFCFVFFHCCIRFNLNSCSESGSE